MKILAICDLAVMVLTAGTGLLGILFWPLLILAVPLCFATFGLHLALIITVLAHREAALFAAPPPFPPRY